MFKKHALVNQETLDEKIIGTWLLKSICQVNDQGEKKDLYGPNPVGILMYSSAGYMNAQLGYGERKAMSSGELTGGTTEEKAEAFDSYVAYFGKYYQSEPGIIVHVVEGCTIPNWVKQKEIRYAQIMDNHLIIRTPETRIGEFVVHLEVIWQRA